MVSVVDEKNTYNNIIHHVYNKVLTECAGDTFFSYYSYILFYYFRKYKRTPRIPRRIYIIDDGSRRRLQPRERYVMHAEEKKIIMNNIIYYITHTTCELTCTKETQHTHTNTSVLATGEKNLTPSTGTCGMRTRHWRLEDKSDSRILRSPRLPPPPPPPPPVTTIIYNHHS